MEQPPPLAPEVLAYYEAGIELRRLQTGTGRLELRRTQDLIVRYVVPPPSVIVDAGGGPGHYSSWLARHGYEVHLVDAVPLHVEYALDASEAQPDTPIASLTVGDARKLDLPDESVDAVLLLGPLYHLTDRTQRVAAMAEGKRVLRNGGVLLGAAISRFAPILDHMKHGTLGDSEIDSIVEHGLREGQYRNPTENVNYFTTAYLHLPSELKEEVEEAGLRWEATVAVEGAGWLVQDFKGQ